MAITFACGQCQQRYQVDDALAGKTITCKQCGAAVSVPNPGTGTSADPFDLDQPPRTAPTARANPYAPPRAPSDKMPRPPGGGGDDAVATLIPYKNSSALTGYYLGVIGFALSCLPLVGLIMPIIAIVLGVKGLKYVRRYPEAHGTAHAWVAIVTGSIGILVQAAIVVLLVIGAITAAQQRR